MQPLRKAHIVSHTVTSLVPLGRTIRQQKYVGVGVLGAVLCILLIIHFPIYFLGSFYSIFFLSQLTHFFKFPKAKT